jgi:hypothetical protein
MHMLVDFSVHIQFRESLFGERFPHFFLLQASRIVSIWFSLGSIKVCLLGDEIRNAFLALGAWLEASTKPHRLFVFKAAQTKQVYYLNQFR